jgi:hypothetical protein
MTQRNRSAIGIEGVEVNDGKMWVCAAMIFRKALPCPACGNLINLVQPAS